MTNIRDQFGWQGSYYPINREERNWTAILYHVLLLPGNLSIFLENINHPFEIKLAETAIYFEYAYLRDLWFQHNDQNEVKRHLICEPLQLHNTDFLMDLPVVEFNRYFGVGNCSRLYVQSPSEWSIDRFSNNFPDANEFLRVCRFKWAFKIKPDLVIHTSHNTAVCIEAKFGSGEGKYPVKLSERAEFSRRGLERVSQTNMQEYLMKDLLGLQTQYVFLVQKTRTKSPTHITLSWKDAFRGLDISQCPPFIQDWLKRIE